MDNNILDILKNNKGSYVSGEQASKVLNVSRAAVWKQIKNLREQGYTIDSISNRGYSLLNCPDILTLDEIKDNLNTKFIGKNIIHFNTINSTNDHAKKVGDSSIDGTVVTSEIQTDGRGRLGRSWNSHCNSISMSIILKPEISIFEAAKITQVCAAAISISLSEFEIENQIKWPNDILICDKKVCGILTEMNSEIDKVNFMVVGIGLNANNTREDFSEEIKNIATSILIETNKKIKKNIIAAKILSNFERLYEEFVKNNNLHISLDICRSKSNILGKNINLIKNNEKVKAKAIDIGNDGELLVEYEDGKKDSIISGEISVRKI